MRADSGFYAHDVVATWRKMDVPLSITARFHGRKLRSLIEAIPERYELAILRRHVSRPERSDADRVFLAAASCGLPRWRWSDFFITPEALLRWHR